MEKKGLTAQPQTNSNFRSKMCELFVMLIMLCYVICVGVRFRRSILHTKRISLISFYLTKKNNQNRLYLFFFFYVIINYYVNPLFKLLVQQFQYLYHQILHIYKLLLFQKLFNTSFIHFLLYIIPVDNILKLITC